MLPVLGDVHLKHNSSSGNDQHCTVGLLTSSDHVAGDYCWMASQTLFAQMVSCSTCHLQLGSVRLQYLSLAEELDHNFFSLITKIRAGHISCTHVGRHHLLSLSWSQQECAGPRPMGKTKHCLLSKNPWRYSLMRFALIVSLPFPFFSFRCHSMYFFLVHHV